MARDFPGTFLLNGFFWERSVLCIYIYYIYIFTVYIGNICWANVKSGWCFLVEDVFAGGIDLLRSAIFGCFPRGSQHQPQLATGISRDI